MAKFHVNPETGNVGKCSATKGKCPFGGDENHYRTEIKAREAFERSMAGEALGFTGKVSPATQKQFCIGAEQHARAALNLSFYLLTNLDKTYYYELDARVVNTRWHSVREALSTLRVLEDASIDLLQRSKILDDESRTERKKSEKLARASEIIDESLAKVPFDLLYVENIDSALARKELMLGKSPEMSTEDYVDDLRASVRDFRSAQTSPEERETIKDYWESNNIGNQFQAMKRASDLEKLIEPKVPCDERHQQRINIQGFCSKCGGAQ